MIQMNIYNFILIHIHVQLQVNHQNLKSFVVSRVYWERMCGRFALGLPVSSQFCASDASANEHESVQI